MMHETLIHRVDAQNAGAAVTGGGNDLETSIATDGVDEMICGFARRYAKTLRSREPATLAFTATDTGQASGGSRSVRMHRNSVAEHLRLLPTPRYARTPVNSCCSCGTAVTQTG